MIERYSNRDSFYPTSCIVIEENATWLSTLVNKDFNLATVNNTRFICHVIRQHYLGHHWQSIGYSNATWIDIQMQTATFVASVWCHTVAISKFHQQSVCQCFRINVEIMNVENWHFFFRNMYDKCNDSRTNKMLYVITFRWSKNVAIDRYWDVLCNPMLLLQFYAERWMHHTQRKNCYSELHWALCGT